MMYSVIYSLLFVMYGVNLENRTGYLKTEGYLINCGLLLIDIAFRAGVLQNYLKSGGVSVESKKIRFADGNRVFGR